MSSLETAIAPAARSIIYLGMDVHKDSLTIAVLPEVARAPTRLEKVPNDLLRLKQWLERVARDGELRKCYGASGAVDSHAEMPVGGEVHAAGELRLERMEERLGVRVIAGAADVGTSEGPA